VLGGIFGRKAGRAMKRLKIAVLFGGCSPEYSVSLQSAAAVLQKMDNSKYDCSGCGPDLRGESLLNK
jgi:D-alanine-D-alanine ligase-like ATP-grasp enzyme